MFCTLYHTAIFMTIKFIKMKQKHTRCPHQSLRHTQNIQCLTPGRRQGSLAAFDGHHAQLMMVEKAKDCVRRHWLVNLADFYFRSKVLGQRIPLLASCKLTYDCNLRCRACPFHLRSRTPEAHMTWGAATAALHTLARLGCRIVVFEGGEPCLWQDGGHGLSELIDHARKLFWRVAVTTNGTFPLNLPADLVWVSLDGLPHTHNRLRSNSFERVWSNLRSATHPRLFVHFTMNRLNWRDLEPLLARLSHAPAVRGLSLQLFYPYGQGEDDLALSEAERAAALHKALELKKRGYPILNSAGRLQAMIANTWTCHSHLLANVDPDGAVSIGCYVLSRGQVRCAACGFTPMAEASGAIDLIPGAIMAGWRIYISRRSGRAFRP